MPKYSAALQIKERRRLIAIMSKKGYSAEKISKRLSKIKDGMYSASPDTVLRDLKYIVKKRQNWEKIHSPQLMDNIQKQRETLVAEYEVLIADAKKKHQFKTAGELIGKKARLLGIDKYVAPKERKKSLLEAKYEHKNQEEINNILFQDFKDLSAALIRMAKNKQLGNIRRITISVVREIEKDVNQRFVISRFGDEKKIKREKAIQKEEKPIIEEVKEDNEEKDELKI